MYKNALAAEPRRRHIFDAFRAQNTCPVAAKCRPISVKRDLTTETNVVVSQYRMLP